MYLTKFAAIGKSFIRNILGVQENYKVEEVVEYTDISICEKCKFFKSNSETSKKYCLNYCKKAKSRKVKTTYYNEANRFHIPVKERLSKSQIKQILLYHFLDVDENGIIKDICSREVSRIIDCDIKTVKNNNDRFRELSHAFCTRYVDGVFSTIIPECKNYSLPRSKGGSGYISMPLDILEELLKIDNVNALRIELRKLIEFDTANINAKVVIPAEYSYSTLGKFLPKYLRYGKAINSVIAKGSNLFENIVEGRSIVFKLKNEYDSNLIKNNMINKCEEIFDEYYEEYFYFSDKDFLSVIKLSLEYGIEVIKETLDRIYRDYVLRERVVKNLGGLMRTVIRRNKLSYGNSLS